MTEKIQEKKPFTERFAGHLKTVQMHRKLVRQCCFACGLYYQGLTHDLSKYSFSEFATSVKYFEGYRSPYMKEKEINGVSQAWLGHKGKNKHHWEYWYDMIGGKWVPVEMPYRYVVEMVCDRVAACKTYQKENYTQESALVYYLNRPAKDYMHPATRDLLEHMLRMIAELGEEEAFAQIRKSIRSGRYIKASDPITK